MAEKARADQATKAATVEKARADQATKAATMEKAKVAAEMQAAAAADTIGKVTGANSTPPKSVACAAS